MLVDAVLDVLQLLEGVEVGGLTLLLQLLAANVRVGGQAPRRLRDLGLDGELALQTLQLLLLISTHTHTHTHAVI